MIWKAIVNDIRLVHDNGESVAQNNRFQSGDGGGGGGDMTNHPTREEMHAKLEATEARLDKSLTEVLSGIDNIRSQVDSQGKILTGRFNTLEGKVGEATSAAKEAKASASTIKWNILFTGLTVAALLFAAFALWTQAVEMTTGIMGTQNSGSETSQ